MDREEELIKRVLARFRCAACNRPFLPENIEVMSRYDSVWIIGVACEACEQPDLYVVSMRKESSLEHPSDLTDEEHEKFLTTGSIAPDDVEAIKDFLQGFNGDFSRMFGKHARD